MYVYVSILAARHNNEVEQKRPRSDECKYRCRPGCSKKFKTKTGRFKHRQQVEKCDRWWRVQEQIDKRRSSTTSSEPSSDVEVEDPQKCEEVAVEAIEPAEYEEWGQPFEETYDALQTIGVDSLPLTDDKLDVFVEEYQGAVQIIDEGPNLYDQLWESDEHFESRKVGGPYYPFSGEIEWEVVQWLHSLDVPMKKIDRFFELLYVSSMRILPYILTDTVDGLGEKPAILFFLRPGAQESH